MSKQVFVTLKRAVILVLVTALCIGTAQLTFGLRQDTALAASQTTTLYPSKDKFHDDTGGYDNWTSSGRSYLYIGQSSMYGTETSAICFDVSSIPGAITSARLILKKYTCSSTFTIDVFGSNNDSWTESGDGMPSQDVAILSNVTVSYDMNGDWTNMTPYDVTDFMEAQRTGDGSGTLVLAPSTATEGDLVIGASEDSTYKPRLEITYTTPSATISASPALTESNVNGASVDVLLEDGITFADATLNKANFSVNGAPFTISNASYTDNTHCTLTLAYGGADFDANKSFGITIAGAELSTGSNTNTINTLTVTATNDAESLSIADDGLISEGAENGEVITATLTGGQFVATLTPANWTVSNLPAGVTKGTVTRTSATTVTIALSGNATEDYDSDITNVSVSCTVDEYTDNTGGGNLSDTGITLTATNDAESLSIADDGLIAEGAENGEVITVTLTGGQFAAMLTPANWTVSNLPAGVTKGTVTRVNDTTVTIALSGNATEDYDSSITNVSVFCTTAEYTDSTGGGSLSDTGITLTATNDAESLSIADDGLISEGAENGEVITVTLTGGQFAAMLTPANWTVSNLPAGVTKGTVTRTSATTVTIALSDNATEDYDSDITNVSVSCTVDEYTDNTGGGNLSDTGITLTATNDAESLSIADDGLIGEGAENGEVITVTLTGGKFAATLTPANWTVSNLPAGVSKGAVARVSATTATIALSGNATEDYDSDITNVSVSCTTAEYTDSAGGGSLSDTGITLTADNDAESLSIADDGLISEGAENGEVITVTLTGGKFAATLTPANWTVSNLPAGVSKGAVARVSATTATIALSGNATEDYDSDITNVSVSCTTAEYTDSAGGGSLSDTGITLTADNDAESLAIADDGLIGEGAENGEVITVTLTGGKFAATLTPANWTVTNLPAGVTKGTVTRTGATTVTIVLSGNATWDYDSDITDVSVSCTDAEYTDSAGGGNLSDTGITLTADNDAETLSITDDGLIGEGAENGEVITATLTGGQFADTITPANWTVAGLPAGVTQGTVTRVNGTTVTITLSGNATWDYDADITITVTCTADEYIDNSGGADIGDDGVTLKAVNDAESLSMRDDGSIVEGKENGEVITVTIAGGQFAAATDPAKWTVSNLPAGVTKGSVIKTGSHTVKITLSGNATADYDSDITNVSVKCAADQYVTGDKALTVSDGVVLKAVVEGAPSPTPTPAHTQAPASAPTLAPENTSQPESTASNIANEASGPGTTSSPTPEPTDKAMLMPVSINEDAQTGYITVEISLEDLPEGTAAIRLPNGEIIQVSELETVRFEINEDELNADGMVMIVALNDENTPLSAYDIKLVGADGKVVSGNQEGSASTLLWIVLICVAAAVIISGLVILLKKKKA